MGKLSKGQKNFALNFLGSSEQEIKDAENGVKTTQRSNPFGGAPHDVEALTAKAIDFVFTLQNLINSRNEAGMKRINEGLKLTNCVQKFDTARMLVLSANSEAYMGILD